VRRFELEGPNSEALAEGVQEETEAMAAFVRGHKATTAEIRALCSDLQVLGRSEFKQLLKWCALLALWACSFGMGGAFASEKLKVIERSCRSQAARLLKR
jgi:hypothetical protein